MSTATVILTAPLRRSRHLLRSSVPAAMAAWWALNLSAVAIGALAATAVGPATTRDLLGFGFGGIDHHGIVGAAQIAGHNSRFVLAPFICLLASHLVLNANSSRRARRRWTSALAAITLIPVAVSMSAVGAGIVAYGDRMITSVMPHLPLEASAYALACALALTMPTRRPRPARIAAEIGACLLLLLASNWLEVLSH
ncbi:hypothetical protein GKE82_23730 [Conexibacter sp. W3-3-2]|uniref:hypothetical protein n=1 Tax=Conexibacter sp. W3-3-2 TaxID=2675227 RepID=UPI0012B8DED7|nr:hypothetical protein [Conexibacter sp. W3-3-2]MTD47217.1 hypothetical protein [Conexibacter sp. W3-3-2]